MDSQYRSQDFAASVLAATTPPQIAAACSSVDAFLRRHASDQSRSFFSVAFPVLLCRLFGFDDIPPPPPPWPPSSPVSSSPSASVIPPASSSSRPASTAWIDQAAADPALAARLFTLLSPDGVLISSIAAFDRHALIRYVFPVERLPEWIRVALQSDLPSSVLSDLSPILNGRIQEDPPQGSPYHIQLNAFEYYMFWFAYYPVSRGNSESAEFNLLPKSWKFKLENWTSSLPVFTGAARTAERKPQCNLYLQLLYAYLSAFVPKNRLASHQLYRSSLLHYSSSYDGTEALLQAESLVYTLVHFWMVDNDFSPLPMNLSRSVGLSFPFRGVLGESPPTPGLGEPLKLLVKYLNGHSAVTGRRNENVVYDESHCPNISQNVVSSKNMMVCCENSVDSWNSVIQRPFYRFILRSFLFCPIGASIKNVSREFDLWMSYLEPWKTSPEDFSEFDPSEIQKSENEGKDKIEQSGKGKAGHQLDLQYSPAWEIYVLSNYLFYSSLVVHFLGFAHKFLHTNIESVILMVHKVMNMLTASKQLLGLLRKVDIAYHSKPDKPLLYSRDDVYKYASTISEQLRDWEDGLSESEADGSFLHENWNHDLKLFGDGEDGAYNLLQLFVLRAEHEIRNSPRDMSSNIQALERIRSQINYLFGFPMRSTNIPTASQADDPIHGRSGIFTPKHPGIGKQTRAIATYKGDWMRRPISDTEVAWLARILVRLSDWMNDSLGLNHEDENDPVGPPIVELLGNEVWDFEGPKELLSMVLALVGSWLSLLGNTIVRFMRTHHMRINLRALASKKFARLLLLYGVFYLMKKVFFVGLSTLTPP